MAKGGRFSLWRNALSASAKRLASDEEESLADLEERLILADLGPHLASALVAQVADSKKQAKKQNLPRRLVLAEALAEKLAQSQGALPQKTGDAPVALLLIGANGSGKTTTTAKLAHFYQAQGLRVLIVACDTFRAAASSQLEEWAQRLGVAYLPAPEAGDPAALAFAGMECALREDYQVVLFDSAGRLHNEAPLMDELAKMKRAIAKAVAQNTDKAVSLTTLLLLDASLGSAAVAQAEQFSQAIGVEGLVVSKLDGSALGGAVARATEATGLPIVAVGLGEGVADLSDFQYRAFIAALLGLEGELLSRFQGAGLQETAETL